MLSSEQCTTVCCIGHKPTQKCSNYIIHELNYRAHPPQSLPCTPNHLFSRYLLLIWMDCCCNALLQCSKSCEKGEKSREVVCADLVRQVEVEDGLCQAKPKPKSRQACNKQPCPFRWVPGHWSQVTTHKYTNGHRTTRGGIHQICLVIPNLTFKSWGQLWFPQNVIRHSIQSDNLEILYFQHFSGLRHRFSKIQRICWGLLTQPKGNRQS